MNVILTFLVLVYTVWIVTGIAQYLIWIERNNMIIPLKDFLLILLCPPFLFWKLYKEKRRKS